jgi:hypothetical protein
MDICAKSLQCAACTGLKSSGRRFAVKSSTLDLWRSQGMASATPRPTERSAPGGADSCSARDGSLLLA